MYDETILYCNKKYQSVDPVYPYYFLRNFDLVTVTGFSSIIDSSQSSLANNSSTAVSSNKNNKVVVLTFDDELKSQYTNAKPILDTYGYKASFSIICEDL